MKKLIIEIVWGLLIFALGYYGGWASCQLEQPYAMKHLKAFSGPINRTWSGL